MTAALIRSTVERDDESGDPLYWSNAYGWAGLASATRFCSDEMRAVKLPHGGEWIVAPDPAAFVMLPSPREENEPEAPADADVELGTLGSLPVDRPGRMNLREQFAHLTPRKLLARSRKFMTRTYFDKVPLVAKPVPTYKQWLTLACVPSRLSSDPPKYPSVPYGLDDGARNELATNPHYLAEFCRLNNLVE